MTITPFEEYKLLLEDNAHISDRRYTVNNIYFSVSTLFLGGVGLLALQGRFSSWIYTGSAVSAAAAGFFIAGHWRQLVANLRRLLNLRIQACYDIESLPEFENSVKIYHRERVEYTKHHSAFAVAASIELQLPRVFQAMYFLSSVALIAVTALVTQGILHTP